VTNTRQRWQFALFPVAVSASIAAVCKKTNMDIAFTCHKCGQQIKIEEAGAGLSVECPACGEGLCVPDPKATSGVKLFDLNIKRVLENWEVHHAIREIIANALDERFISQSAATEIFMRFCQGSLL